MRPNRRLALPSNDPDDEVDAVRSEVEIST